MFLDRLDKAILRQLQSDASVSNVKLAEIVNLSAPACLKRVKRLEDQGVINKRVALLDQTKFGSCLHMIVQIMMHQDRLDLNETFSKAITNCEQVHECYKVTGEVDSTVNLIPSFIISVSRDKSTFLFFSSTIYKGFTAFTTK